MTALAHPSTATRERSVPCTWCRQATWNDSAVCCDVACQNAELHARRRTAPSPLAAMAVGERVRFVGLNPRPWETTGILTATDGPIARVVWDSDPFATGRPLHVSQIEALS